MERSGVGAKHFVLFCSLFSDEYFAFSLLSCCFFVRRPQGRSKCTFGALWVFLLSPSGFGGGTTRVSQEDPESSNVSKHKKRERGKTQKAPRERRKNVFFVFFVEVLAKTANLWVVRGRAVQGRAVQWRTVRAGREVVFPSISGRLGEAQRRSKSSSKAAIATKKQQSKQVQANRETQQQSSIKSRSENSSTSKSSNGSAKGVEEPNHTFPTLSHKKNTRAVAKKNIATSHKTVSESKTNPPPPYS